jgi:hypothetical protein
MTDLARISADGQRDSLRARIDAAERRNAERTLADNARDAATAAVDYTRAHPFTVIGGALALGLVIGLMTRPGRQVARRVASSASGAVSNAAASTASGAKTAAARGGSKVGVLLGEAVLGYVMTLVDEALGVRIDRRLYALINNKQLSGAACGPGWGMDPRSLHV